MNDQRHPELNHYAVASFMKQVKPELKDLDLECICQKKRLLYEGEESVINLLINLFPDLWQGWSYKPPPTMNEIEEELSKRLMAA